MEQELDKELLEWKKDLEAVWRHIPKPYRSEYTVRRTLQCHLYGLLRDAGLRVVADYMPPRVQDRAVDVIALNEDQEIVYAVCFDSLVALASVKSLTSFASVHKIIFTTSKMLEKVKQSRFFLKPEVTHVHLEPFGADG